MDFELGDRLAEVRMTDGRRSQHRSARKGPFRIDRPENCHTLFRGKMGADAGFGMTGMKMGGTRPSRCVCGCDVGRQVTTGRLENRLENLPHGPKSGASRRIFGLVPAINSHGARSQGVRKSLWLPRSRRSPAIRAWMIVQVRVSGVPSYPGVSD